MATEKRLIDANALEAHFRKTKFIEVFPYWKDLDFATQCELAKYATVCKEIILSAPTVDAVEVVRCKDCKHCCLDLSGRENHLCMRKENGFVVRRKTYDFCSYGERKDNGEKNG